MSLPTIRQSVVLTVDLLLLAAGLTNISKVVERPSVPLTTALTPQGVVVQELTNPSKGGSLQPGDVLLQVEGTVVRHPEAVVILSDRSVIGHAMTVVAQRGPTAFSTTVSLVPFYSSPRFAVVTALVAVLIWCLGAFITLQRSRGMTAAILHWSFIMLATSLFFTQGRIADIDSFWQFRRSALIVSYFLMPLGFLAFSLVYPRPKLPTPRLAVAAGAAVGGAIALTITLVYVGTLENPDPDHLSRALGAYNLMHVLQALMAVGMMGSVLHSYVTSISAEDRSRLQWILWGLVAGPAPYLLLIVIPQILVHRDLIPEEIAIAFLAVTPLSFAVSFLRHQILDIRVVINRSIVYATLTVFVGVLYGLAVLLVTSSVGETYFVESQFLLLLFAGAVAFSLNPLRRRLQRGVDALLFPLKRRYGDVLSLVMRGLHRALSIEEAAGVLAEECVRLLPLRGAAVCLAPEGSVQPCASRGAVDVEAFVRAGPLPAFVKSNTIVQKNVPTPGGSDQELRRILLSAAVDLLAPLVSGDGRTLGVLVGSLHPGVDRLAAEEAEFLSTVTAEATEVMDRLDLQRRVILDQEERRRSDELNRLKSFFVSSVSHELRTPLTSVRMFAEMIRTNAGLSRRSRREYLQIIEGEIDRLTRMIDNILDFSKIEQGLKQYRFAPVHIEEIVRQAEATMAYHFRSAGGVLRVRCPRRLPAIEADADALLSVLINLLTNALKYSGRRKQVRLSLQRKGQSIVIEVADRGLGIPKDEIPKIFDRFYRIRRYHERQVGGTGLGLALVKHTVEAHRGTIDVSSVVGRGTTFCITIPWRQREDRSAT